MIEDATRGVEFSTFVIGAILRPSLLDRDDAVRSAHHLKGSGSIKSEITQYLTRRFRRVTDAAIDYDHPDLTVTVNFRDDSVHIHTRPITISGRYTKRRRGIPQKRQPDTTSVEKQISEFLLDVTGARRARITWIGGEDKQSLVLGDGRPFLARMFNPRRQNPSLPSTHTLPDVGLACLAASPDSPVMPIPFRSVIRIRVSTEDAVSPALLRSLRMIPKTPVLIYNDTNRINQKRIYSLRYRRRSPNLLTISIEAQGGLPVKRFIEGDSISPSVADMLETSCTCLSFDFLQVILEK